MTRFDWDRESREARKRKHGSIPALADPLSHTFADEHELERQLRPMQEAVRSFSMLSTTSRRQRK